MNKRAKSISHKILAKCNFYKQLENALSAEGKSVESHIQSNMPVDFIIRSFDWMRTAEGFDFWQNIHNAWIEFINKDNQKPMMKYLEANDEINSLINYFKGFKKDDEFFDLSEIGLLEVFKKCSFYSKVEKKYNDANKGDFEIWLKLRKPSEWLDCITDENEMVNGVKWVNIKKSWNRFCDFGNGFNFIKIEGEFYTYEKGEHPFMAIEKFYMKSNMPTEKTTVNQAFSIKVKKPEHKLNFKL